MQLLSSTFVKMLSIRVAVLHVTLVGLFIRGNNTLLYKAVIVVYGGLYNEKVVILVYGGLYNEKVVILVYGGLYNEKVVILVYGGLYNKRRYY